MYLTYVKATMVEAVKESFDGAHRESDFRNLWVSVEYPIDKATYPAIWVNFDPIGTLKPVGMGYYELDGDDRRVYRWSFAGTMEFTCVAMSSLERDRLYDAVCGMLAFGYYGGGYGNFRSYIETNERIALSVQGDQVDQRGFSASPGTPWGTDEMMYEATAAIDVIGEFVSAAIGDPLLPVTAIEVVKWVEDIEEMPSLED